MSLVYGLIMMSRKDRSILLVRKVLLIPFEAIEREGGLMRLYKSILKSMYMLR